jgi:hypothetical protein
MVWRTSAASPSANSLPLLRVYVALCEAMPWPESKKAAKLLLYCGLPCGPFDYYSRSYSLLAALGDGRNSLPEGQSYSDKAVID